MTDKDIDDWIENESLTREDIIYLLNKLCRLGTESETAITEKVTVFLKTRGKLNRVSREETANYLNMSARTLSRKLQKEKRTFYQLLNKERKRRCLIYLQCETVCGRQMTELLGLSDISHFYKAFKQWTGYSFSEAKSIMAKNH